MPAAAGLLSVGLALVAAAIGTVLMLLPDPVGRTLLADTWDPAQEVLLPITVSMAAGGMVVGAQMGLHALVAVRRSLGARVALSIMLVTFKVTGAWLGGAVGAAWGGALAMWLGTLLWWFQFRTAWAGRPAQRTGADPSSAPARP